jgi:hypothetical protein
MFASVMTLSATLAVALTSADPKASSGPSAESLGWITNYGAAIAAAKESKRPLFVVFRCER